MPRGSSTRCAKALGAYLRLAKADRIEWPTELRTEKRLFGTGVM